MQTLQVSLPNATFWTPTNPYLYNITVALQTGDSINSYFGVRTFSMHMHISQIHACHESF